MKNILEHQALCDIDKFVVGTDVYVLDYMPPSSVTLKDRRSMHWSVVLLGFYRCMQLIIHVNI